MWTKECTLSIITWSKGTENINGKNGLEVRICNNVNVQHGSTDTNFLISIHERRWSLVTWSEMVSLSTSLVCRIQNCTMLRYTNLQNAYSSFHTNHQSNFFCTMPPVLVAWKCHMRQTSVVLIYCAIPYIIIARNFTNG